MKSGKQFHLPWPQIIIIKYLGIHLVREEKGLYNEAFEEMEKKLRKTENGKPPVHTRRTPRMIQEFSSISNKIITPY